MTPFEVIWEAPEFEYREKDISWYWISIIAAALFIAFSIFQKNFLFGFFVVVAEILFIIWGNRLPRVLTFVLNDHSLVIDGQKLYHLKEFESWSENPFGEDWSELIFHFRSRIRPPLMIIVPDDTFEILRPNLGQVLKEIEYDPSLIDSIEKLLHF